MNSVTRTTTLQLSHGMVKRFLLNGVVDNGSGDVLSDVNVINYFNIINFGKDWKRNDDLLNADNWRDLISGWKVNRDVFNFFLKKIQFLYYNN